jgi:hypothetical protein
MNLYQLTIAVMAIAVAQALTILLTIGREREIKKMRELITEQRIYIAEMRAWINGRMQSAQSRIKPDRGPVREPKAEDKKAQSPELKPKELTDSIQPRTTNETEEDATKRLNKATSWLNEDADKAREIVAVFQRAPRDKIG